MQATAEIVRLLIGDLDKVGYNIATQRPAPPQVLVFVARMRNGYVFAFSNLRMHENTNVAAYRRDAQRRKQTKLYSLLFQGKRP